MKVSEFIRKKNEILRKTIGIDFDLVPEDQIEECEQFVLSLNFSCPYCKAYKESCSKCPMDIANNNCVDKNSTWDEYGIYCSCNNVFTHNHPASPAYESMKNLIDKYNKELNDDK